LTASELNERLRTARADLHKLRADQGTKQLDNPLRIRQLRRLIARILTLKNEEVRGASDTSGIKLG
jgi:large subunit ribosomal protein L29